MSRPSPSKVLTIAGSDPTGGAGLQLDLRVFACHGVHGMAVATALTIQTPTKVGRILPVFPNILSEQLEPLLRELAPDIIKIGMLATDDILLRTAGLLDRFPIPRVVDPVLRASDGSYLLERRAWKGLGERIIGGARLVTPNLDEAECLTGSRDPEQAAHRLIEAGAQAVLIKGGHASGPADDFLLDRAGARWLRGNRCEGEPVHGTGCALASAISARLARGEALEAAVEGAKRWVEQAIANAFPCPHGGRLLQLGPA